MGHEAAGTGSDLKRKPEKANPSLEEKPQAAEQEAAVEAVKEKKVRFPDASGGHFPRSGSGTQHRS